VFSTRVSVIVPPQPRPTVMPTPWVSCTQLSTMVGELWSATAMPTSPVRSISHRSIVELPAWYMYTPRNPQPATVECRMVARAPSRTITPSSVMSRISQRSSTPSESSTITPYWAPLIFVLRSSTDAPAVISTAAP
jgi:hypothetical protein